MNEFPRKITFKKWLEQKDFSAIVAENWSCYTCPLANFIMDKYNFDSAYASPEIGYGTKSVWRFRKAESDEWSELMDMPKWAERFAHAVDRANPNAKSNGFVYPAITAGHCLKILEEI